MIFLKLIRIHQWTKNFFLFAALFFSGNLLDEEKLIPSIIGFFCFCLIASSIYIINDYMDIESDKIHPEKQHRPLASGKINKTVAMVTFLIFLIASLTIAFSVNKAFFVVLLIYFTLNILYSIKLKQIAIIDIVIVSIGFVLRVAAGGVLSGIEVSHWLYIMTFLLALFIAMAKRRDDVLILNSTGTQHRKSINGYNLEFIGSSITVLSSIIIVSYLLYITSSEVTLRFNGKHPYISTIFVILGVLRYLQITFVEGKSGSPSKILLKDRFIQLIITSWVLFFITIIYFL